MMSAGLQSAKILIKNGTEGKAHAVVLLLQDFNL